MGWSDLARAIELRREPYLQSVHPNGVQLRFRTDLSVEERCVVRIGRDWNRLDRSFEASIASVDEGKEVLMTRDEFIERLSPFDRAARLKVERTVDEPEYLEFVGANVVAWEAEEKRRVRDLVAEIRDSLLAFDLPLPPMVLMIKTTGREEGAAAYTRGSAIVLPESDLEAPAERIQRKICHELFHILSRHNPALRERLYGAIGFEKCDELELPAPLNARRITNPDAPRNDHCIRVEVDGTRHWAIPVLYSRTETYDADRGGEFFDYLEFQLLLVDRAEGSSAVAPLRRDNGPWLVGVQDVRGFFEQVGRNTGYIIHPEEILADNFAMIMMGDTDAPSPEVLQRVESILRNPGVK